MRSGKGLTIGVGMGLNKMLAKSAQRASKEWPQFGGVLALTSHNPKRTEKLLSLQPVEEIWGVGRRLSKTINSMGITTALQLARASPVFIRWNFTLCWREPSGNLTEKAVFRRKKHLRRSSKLSLG